MGYDDMSYEKCIDCKHSRIYQSFWKTWLYCRMTGKSFKLKHCKHYYGTKEKEGKQ